MIWNRDRKMRQIIWLGAVLSCFGLLFAMPCSAQKAPRGKAVIVFDELFTMNGGDCHTSKAGVRSLLVI